jgi:hypothetical protein
MFRSFFLERVGDFSSVNNLRIATVIASERCLIFILTDAHHVMPIGTI